MLEVTKKLNVPSHKQSLQVKTCLLGDQQSGKTSLAIRYTQNTFMNNYHPTLGVETANKYINQKNSLVHVTLWDFSGKLDFVEIRNQFYRQIHTAIICVDLSTKISNQSIDYWIREIKDGGGSPTIFIVGTKSDIKKGNQLSKIASDKGCPYFQTSSKNGQGIQDLMNRVINQSK